MNNQHVAVTEIGTTEVVSDGFEALREAFPSIICSVQRGTYIDHGYVECYDEPFGEEAIRKAQNLLITTTDWLVRDIAWTIRDGQIKTNAIFLIRRRNR